MWGHCCGHCCGTTWERAATWSTEPLTAEQRAAEQRGSADQQRVQEDAELAARIAGKTKMATAAARASAAEDANLLRKRKTWRPDHDTVCL